MITPFTSNNSGGGINFDVVLNKQLKITGFDLNLPSNSNSVRFYYRVGTSIGNELDPSGWILVEEATLTSQGTNTMTRFDFTNPLTLPAGTYGFYFVAYGIIRYSNGTSVASVLASNADLTMYEARGRSVITPGNEFSVFPIDTRRFSGRVNYESDTYTFSWSNFATSRSISGLTAGPYTLTVTAASDNSSQNQTFNVTQPNALVTTNASSQTNIDCVNATGTASVTVSGGTIPYTYEWSGNPTGNGTSSVTGLTAGTWTCTITDSKGCTTSRVFNITNRTASISYSGTPFCKTASPANVTFTGTAEGAFTSSPAGLTLDGSSGQITPSSSTAGTYTVTYTIAASGECAAVIATTGVTITNNPTANISYAGTPYCRTASASNVTFTGTTGGAFTSSPAGLTLNGSSGQITPSSSTAGTYTVTYTIAASGGCAAVTATTGVTITNNPAANISYTGTPYCRTASASNVTFTGTTGGAFTSSPAGLTLNGTNGQITPSSSTAGTYTVTYTIAASGGCAAVTATTGVTITNNPTANISYTGTPYCRTASASNVTFTGTTGGAFTSSPAGLTLNGSSGQITPSSSTAGTYTVTYTIAASGGCAAVTATTGVTITNNPTANISYTGTPYCRTASASNVTFTGTTGGAFTSSPAGLTLNGSSGQITPSSSTAGTYTVTYTIAASGGCAAVTATTGVTINNAPNTSIAYPGATICKSAGTTDIIRSGTTGGTFSSSPSGLILNSSTGRITPSTSTAGNYTVTLTIAASGGCSIYTATTAITITAEPSATIGYAANSFCNTASVQNITRNGTAGGTYSAQPAGLTIDTNTGQITPSSSTANNYVVYYTVPASGGCDEYQTSFNVSIGTPASATITYAASDFCSTDGVKSVNRNGTTGGMFTSSPAGLTIGSSNGLITPSSSSAGTYTVTYTIAANSGCPAFTTTTSVAITTPASATISYTGSPFCGVTTPINVNRTGTTGGTFSSSPTGLSLNTSTGQITPSSSTGGTYTVTYSVTSACPLFTATTNVSLNSAPSIPSNVTTSTNLICGNESVSLVATCSNGVITWYNQATGGTAIGTGSPLLQTPSATTKYYVTCNNAPCESGRTATNQVVVERGNGGTSTPYTNASLVTRNNLFYNKYTISRGITADSVSVITHVGDFGSIQGNARIKIAIYSDLNGDPHTLLASSDANANTATPFLVEGVNKFRLNSPVNLSCGTYWIGYVLSSNELIGANFNNGNPVPDSDTKYSSFNFENAFPTTNNLTKLTNGFAYNVYFSGKLDCQIPPPTVTQNVDVCNGNTATLTATCSTGVVIWYTSATSSAGTTNSPFVTPAISANTSYYVACVSTGCSSNRTQVNLNVIQPPNAQISGSDNLSCAVNSVTRTASGGVSYSWSNGLGTNATVNISTAGTYTVTVTAANGCTATATTVVTNDGTLPNAQISGSDNLSCAVNSVTRTASGGVSYSWSNGLGTNATVNISTAGTYTVTVTAANGCTATATTVITNDGTLPNAQISGSDNLSCAVNSVTRTASGGVSYSWSNGLGTNATVNISTAGTYTVTVTAANGCTATATTVVTNDGTLPNAQISGSDNLSCAVNSVTRTASGGVSYSWSNGLGTNATVNIASAGTYTVTVTAANGCTAMAATVVTNDGTLPNAQISGSDNLSCAVNSVTRTASGGVSYLWSNGLGTNATVNISSAGTYTVTVTAANGCTATATTVVTNDGTLPNAQISGSDNLSCAVNSVTRTASGGVSYSWSNGLGTNATVNISSAGTYTVTVTAANGCTATATTVVTNDGTLPNAQISGSDNLSCAVNSVTRTASGGVSYSWSNGLGTNATVNISTAGTYTVTVTAANGCTATATTVVTNDGTLPNAQISGSDNLSCAVNSVTRTASGGVSYSWSNGLGTNATVNISTAGTYTVTVTAANGCTATATTVVTNDGTLPNAQISGSDNLSCAVNSVTRTASGGVSYSWSNGLGTNATVNISTAGTYTVTVTAANGCTATATTVITNDGTLPNAQISGSDNLSCAVNSVTRTASGGVSYSWSNGLGTNATVNISTAGTYTVTVTAANGCTATATTVVTNDGTLPNAQISGSDNLSCAVNSVTRTASGGVSYSWSNGLGTNATVNISTAGTYTVTVTAANGCTATATTVITNDGTLPNAQISGSDNLSCAVNSVTRTASGGVSYSWSNGLGTNATVNISTAGTYTVTVTAANGCTATATTSVTFTNDLTANATNTGPYQIGNTIELSATGGNGTPTVNYAWTGPNNFVSTVQNPTISGALATYAGVYTVIISSGTCSTTATTNVIINAGIDPCIPIIDYQFVKSGNPYQPLFSLTNGMKINQLTDPVSIIAVPICPTINIESLNMQLQGPNVNVEITQNISPYAIFDNTANSVNGQVLTSGVYTLTVTGYTQDNLLGNINYGPVTTTFTILPTSASIETPTVSKTALCIGSNLEVSFSTTGVFNPINQFKVELSDVNGNFGSIANVGNTGNSATFTYPTIIGTSNSAGVINCSIPNSIEGGTNYRIRVVSTDGVSVSQINSDAITIHPKDLNLISPTDDFSTNIGTKQASNKVTATNKINASAAVNYQAGKAIILNAGFEANAGTVFKAEIKGCSN